MDEPFSIVVICHGQEYSFEARLATMGYTHKFYVMINGMEVIYEPDEERSYRAIMNDIGQGVIKDSDIELIKAVGDKIELIRQT
jgi:hypothetical protein